MRIVSNTSPISNLAIIDRLDFLHRRYTTVSIPEPVAVELAALTHLPGKRRIEAALASSWIIVNDVSQIAVPSLPFALDAGETAAIALALHTKADVLLIDERRGREAARHVGLKVAGVLAELLHARFNDWIPNVHSEITRLRHEAGFFVDAQIEQYILEQVGEG